MTYRSLLLHVDSSPLCPARSNLAISLAQAMECHLVGLAPTGLLTLPVVPEAAIPLAEFSAMAWEFVNDQAQQASEQLRQSCVTAGLKSFEALVDVADEAESLVRHSHCSDLVMLSQPDPTAFGHRADQAMLEQVLMHSARPSLVLPYTGTFTAVGQRVLVAWDQSREAARAVADALPLLRRAQQVEVISWTEGSDGDTPTRPSLDALRQWLLWHGVAAEVRSASTTIGIADTMLSHAADFDADLIVMGAYGHARWTERLLGGATRGLLASMTVPVLMSH